MKKNGFSNIEILVVIVVLAVLILIAMPLVSMVMSSSKKTSLKNELSFMPDSFCYALNTNRFVFFDNFFV